MGPPKNPVGQLEKIPEENLSSLENIHTTPHTRPLARIENLMLDIAGYFAGYLNKLPIEVVRLYHVKHGGDFLARLDLIIRDHVLDDFLRDHPKCLRLIQDLLGCRYSYLMQPDLNDDGGNTIQRRAPGGIPSPKGGSFAEAFKPRRSERIRKMAHKADASWIPSFSTHPTADSERVVPASIVYDCIDTYNKFEPLSTVGTTRTSNSDRMTLAELERVEMMYHLVNPVSLSKLTRDELIQRLPNLPQRMKTLIENPKTTEKQIEEEIRKFLVGSLIASQDDTRAEFELELKFTYPSPELDNLRVEEPVVITEEPQPAPEPRGHSTLHDSELHPYKGWYIEGPRTQLVRAKNFLSDEDVDRTIDWERKFAELTEYFSYLHSIFTGEDWGRDLKDAVGMLRAHWIFENYHYGKPLLIVDFPKNVWPKQSKRLPRLPGPDIVVCPESTSQRDLTGPRSILFTKVASAHDQQYEMPVDILKGCYLKAYWNDADEFWENGGQAEWGVRLNLVQRENEHFEECIREGIVHTARFLVNEGRFQYSPTDVQIGSDGAKTAKSESLEAFARFRGGKRAALQQCLNIFNHSENRHMCTPWRTLTLPEPKQAKKRDVGIVYTTMMLKDPPKKESRDPWAYTRAYQWYKKEEMRWAQWAREHAIKDSYGHKLWLRSDEPVMQLPKNWMGPVIGDLMDLDMKKTYELLRRCQKIYQGLRRASKRAPREFIDNVMKMVDAGLKGQAWSELTLSFGKHEFISTGNQALKNIRPTEAAWLEYICQRSRNHPGELEEPLGKNGEIMLFRVIELMKDISPIALFRDMQPRTMDEFLKELNLSCSGPVKRYRFTREDVMQIAPKLHILKVIKIYQDESGEWLFGRPGMEFHPEDLVRWPRSDPEPEPEPEQERQPRVESTPWWRWGYTDDQNQPAENPGKAPSVRSVNTISTEVTVPLSAEDFHEYPDSMPRKKDICSLREYVKNPTKDPGDAERTTNFFYCLGYRLGISLNTLKELHERGQEKLKGPKVQEYNRDFLHNTIRFWVDDVRKRPNDPDKNPQKKGTWRETLIYSDVVNIADPDTFKQHKEEWTKREWPDVSLARRLVRENIVREVYENKTMLWPLPLPYNSYVQKYKVVDPTPERNRREARYQELWARQSAGEDVDPNTALLSEGENGDEEEEKQQQQPDTRTLRREPIWSFAYRSRRPRARRFWDINNWPVHLQVKERQKVIRSRGPRRQHAEATTRAKAKGTEHIPHGLPEGEEEIEIPFWKRAEERENFIPGSTEYWLGDTPYQRKVFENRIRKRLERPRKRRWYERFWSTPQKDKPVTDEDMKLPDIDPDMIPKSRPRKRQRTLGPFVETDEDIAPPLIPPGTKIPGLKRNTVTVPIMWSGTSEVEHVASGSKAVGLKLDLPMSSEAQAQPAITYYIPETPAAQGDEDADEQRITNPFIVYRTPKRPGFGGN